MRLLLKRLARDTDGFGTVHAIALSAILALMGGAAVDISNAWRVREILQSTAEAAALSAAVRASEPMEDETPRDVAQRITLSALDGTALATSWDADSFALGRIDASKGFVRDQSPPNAVQVTLARTDALQRPVSLMFLQIFGFEPWSITGRATALFEARPRILCEDPLLSLQGRADVAARDVYVGICLRASAEVDYGARPAWLSDDAARMLSGLIAEASGLADGGIVDLGGVSGPQIFRDTYAQATTLISPAALSEISVLSDGTYRVDCDSDRTVHLHDDLVLRNAALYAACPLRTGARIDLSASIVVSNLGGLLAGSQSTSVIEDTLHPEPVACRPGAGVKVLVDIDARAAAELPALVDRQSPFSRFFEETVEETGTVLGSLVEGLNPLTETVEDTAQQVIDLASLPVCIGVETLFTRDTVALR
ncbi:pilus assembly protein TadG-related protein [Litorisediminicola beolgyonensis]|uniref:Pilus assembly protein TadG-related protein n=1 Tax=Litorisediminicola beolgyonensis TaxID=1173614 RepID=A0ABW3ZLQ1_9RHOB